MVAYDKKSCWGRSQFAGISHYVEGPYPPLHGSDRNYYKDFDLSRCALPETKHTFKPSGIDPNFFKQFYELEYKGGAMQEKAIMPNQTDLQPIMQTPQEIVDDAAEKAKVLRDVVKQADLARKFGGKKEHLEFEAWQTIGKFYGCTPVTEWTRPIKDGDKTVGWEARVKVVDSEGREVAAAENMCMRDEPNWKDKPNYALRSMAQTRAGGKALRSVFAFVAVLAGYSATPSEEMMDSFNGGKKTEKPKQKSGEMSKEQRAAIRKAGKIAKLSDTETTELVHYIANRENLNPNSYKICDFLLGKDDDGNWKIDTEIKKYVEARGDLPQQFQDQPEPETDDLPI